MTKAKIFIVAVAALLVGQGQPGVTITAAQTGINGTALSPAATTSAINMQQEQVTNQLALNIVVTAGTSLVVQVSCQESTNGSVWNDIHFCDSANPSACVVDKRVYTLSNSTTIVSRWGIRQRYARCTLEDTGAGTGTAVVTAERSWQ
jgi:hypothetical protein